MFFRTYPICCKVSNMFIPKVRLLRLYSASGKSRYKIKSFKGLLENEVLYGRSVCNIALQISRRPIFRLHLLKLWETSEPTDSRVLETIELASKRGIPTSYKDRRTLDNMSSHRPHQSKGICLEVGELPYVNLDEESCKTLCTTATHHSKIPIWILLVGIIDPMNMGAILRSCLYFNVDNVIATTGCAPITPVLSKASSGAAEILQVYSTDDPDYLVKFLRKTDWNIVGTVSEEQQFDNSLKNSPTVLDISDAHIGKPSIIIFGNEGSGIPAELLDLCTMLVSIKASPPCIEQDSHQKSLRNLVGSLNVSTAAAVILHEMTKKRIQ
uniref:rRNA methyltransferase 1, mitochondrial-like isoform X1 n=1 Tax=Styela clava TaxID=7725 RepID=UPI00193A320C|nr:rRNA methyltransferase 1, mitochondrial-like isoform X1 [Styela clava]